ncbi:carbon-nitrogen hydrolase family protein [Streptomyces erythrochromogenes]|uniref:carbon-nitrogen hydrolase family protein n=1 Tax=Streptomyces erythrochromogenes TaxID=285574 RepID=UPI00343BC106
MKIDLLGAGRSPHVWKAPVFRSTASSSPETPEWDLPHHTDAVRRLRLAVAQSIVPEDPADPALIRASGSQIRTLMREAAAEGARLVQFPEGAIVYPDPDTMPQGDRGRVSWTDAAWVAIGEEEESIRLLAGELGLWVAFGTIRRLPTAESPRNSLMVVSDRGEIIARYDKRILSHTEATRLYSPGSEPVVFDIDGLRVGCVLCIEANFPELFAQYEALDVDVVLLSVMVDDAARAVVAQAYGTLFNYWIGYSVPAQFGSTAPAGVIAPGGRWLARCPAEDRPGLAVVDLDLDAADQDISIGLRLARPWRRLARVQSRKTGLIG